MTEVGCGVGGIVGGGGRLRVGNWLMLVIASYGNQMTTANNNFPPSRHQQPTVLGPNDMFSSFGPKVCFLSYISFLFANTCHLSCHHQPQKPSPMMLPPISHISFPTSNGPNNAQCHAHNPQPTPPCQQPKQCILAL